MDKWISEISQIVLRTGATLKGPIPLPTHKQKFTVNRSPHIDKKSREQFEMRTHKRLLIINEPTAQTLKSLMALDMPADLDIDLKLPSTETVLSAA